MRAATFLPNFIQCHQCESARSAGCGGKKNGDLLALAEEAGFEVLITVDRNLHQQNLHDRKIALLVRKVRWNRLEDLLPLVPACLEALRSVRPGEVMRVE